jgi:cell shape-determining protein MreC
MRGDNTMLNKEEKKERKAIIKQLREEIQTLKKEKTGISELIKNRQDDIKIYLQELKN